MVNHLSLLLVRSTQCRLTFCQLAFLLLTFYHRTLIFAKVVAKEKQVLYHRQLSLTELFGMRETILKRTEFSSTNWCKCY